MTLAGVGVCEDTQETSLGLLGGQFCGCCTLPKSMYIRACGNSFVFNISVDFESKDLKDQFPSELRDIWTHDRHSERRNT